MKTTTFLAALLLAAALAACSEDPFFEVEGPAAPKLKEQLQNDEELYPRPAPGNEGPAFLDKEQLQDQDEARPRCPGCRPLPPGPEIPLFLLKEQLQGDQVECYNCRPVPPGAVASAWSEEL